MKKFPLFFLIILFCGNSYSQVIKGKKVVSGVIVLNTDNSSLNGMDRTFEGFSISPSFGYYFRDNMALLMTGNYSSNSSESGNSLNSFRSATISYSAGPVLRYNRVIAGNLSYFLGLGVSYTQIRDKFRNNSLNTAQTTEGVNAALSFGLAYFVKDNIAADLSLFSARYGYYRSEIRDTQSGTTSNTFNLELFKLGLGIGFYF